MTCNSIQLIKKCNTFLFDCDGVVYHKSCPLPGAIAAINKLRLNGKRIFFVTNNNTNTRDQFFDKLNKVGFKCSINECFCTSYITGKYLANLKFKQNVYLIGSPNLRNELKLHGIRSFGVGRDDYEDGMDEVTVDASDDVGAVVVGYDKYLSFIKISKAMAYLNNPNVLFIATNTDASIPTSNSESVPGTGVMVSAIKTASGREPVVLGKPSKYMFTEINKETPIDVETTCMVGDRIDTDILFAARNNIKSVLVLSGATSIECYEYLKEQFEKNPHDAQSSLFAKPDLICTDIKQMVDKIFN